MRYDTILFAVEEKKIFFKNFAMVSAGVNPSYGCLLRGILVEMRSDFFGRDECSKLHGRLVPLVNTVSKDRKER